MELSTRNLKNKVLDENDWYILGVLLEQQGLKPISTYDISKYLENYHNIIISQSTIYNKIKKLEDFGVILNYNINFCPKKLGFKGKYIVRIKPKDPSKYNELALKLEKNPFITDLFRIGEQYGLFAIVRVKEIENYSDFIRTLYTKEIEDTYTNFVLDEHLLFSNFTLF